MGFVLLSRLNNYLCLEISSYMISEYIIEEDFFSKEKTLKWIASREDIDGEKEYTSLLFPLISLKWSGGIAENAILISFNWEEGKPYIVIRSYDNQKCIPKRKLKNENVVFVFENGDSFPAKIIKVSNNNELYLAPIDNKGYNAFLKQTILGVSIPFFKECIVDETVPTFLSAHFSLPSDKEILNMREHLKSYLKVCKKEFGWQPEVYNITNKQGFSYQAKNTCYVYLMHDSTNDYYKIGISNNPEYREKTLLGEKPTISLLAYRKYPSRIIASSIETALHNAFSLKRIRGEWFRLDDYDVWQIKEALK